MTTYRWESPQEWLTDKVAELERMVILLDGPDPFPMMRALASALGADAIQDLFQDEMEEDGYFEPVERQRGKR